MGIGTVVMPEKMGSERTLLERDSYLAGSVASNLTRRWGVRFRLRQPP